MRSLRAATASPAGTARQRPDGAVDKGLLLPDGHGLLERVDQPAAGLEGLRAMRRGDHDQHAGLADLQAAEAVNDRDVAHAEAGDGLVRQLLHLLGGHLFVGFVVEMERAAAAGVVAHDAVEDDDRAVLAALESGNEFFGCDGVPSKRGVESRLCVFARVFDLTCASRDGRQQADFVALAQHLRGGGVLGVDADGDAAEPGGGPAGGDASEQVGDGGAVGQLERGRGCAEVVLQNAEWENDNLHLLSKDTAWWLDGRGGNQAEGESGEGLGRAVRIPGVRIITGRGTPHPLFWG